MKKLFFVFFLLVVTGMYAQHKGIVKGHILDKEKGNEPLLFANIELKGTSWATQSNLFGKFKMTDVDPGMYTLVISFAGYKTAKVPIEVVANEVIEIQYRLGAEQVSLDELSLISENTQSAGKLTSSLEKGDKE